MNLTSTTLLLLLLVIILISIAITLIKRKLIGLYISEIIITLRKSNYFLESAFTIENRYLVVLYYSLFI